MPAICVMKKRTEKKNLYNFDAGIERRGTNCVKWDAPFITKDVTLMWIADMDFQVAPAITENLKAKFA